MKISTQRIIIFQEDGLKPKKFTDPREAAEFWARAKEEEWVEKNKANPKYQKAAWSRRMITSNLLYGEGRVRYRKLKRRALRVFRKVMESC